MFEQAYVWLNDPLNWTNPDGVLALLVEHLQLTGLALLLACAAGWPLGVWLGHSGRGGAVVATSNLTRAVPTIALLALFPLTALGFGQPATVLALAVFAVPPLLATAYTGMNLVDPDVKQAAVGMGLSGPQRLFRVELPLAAPQMAGGFRTAAVQTIATASLAALFSGGGLGEIIARGFGLTIAVGGGQILAGGLLIAALALAVEGLLALAERILTPRALRAA